MIKNILFDLDGTLADTALDLTNALNSVRLSYELTELPTEIISWVYNNLLLSC